MHYTADAVVEMTQSVTVEQLRPTLNNTAELEQLFAGSTPTVDRAGRQAIRWLQVLREGLGHEPVLLVAKANGVIVGVLPLDRKSTRLNSSH